MYPGGGVSPAPVTNLCFRNLQNPQKPVPPLVSRTLGTLEGPLDLLGCSEVHATNPRLMSDKKRAGSFRVGERRGGAPAFLG